jgi:hypothetical protein
MALVQRKFTELPGASALGVSDIIPIVVSPTNVNKKITGQTLVDSVTNTSLPTLTSYLIDNDLIVDASILNPDNFIRPIQNDAVERIRASNPESLIDTDFEYSLQSPKWETLPLTNNIPSVFIRSNEPSFTNQQITSITPFVSSFTTLLSAVSSEVFISDPRSTRNGPISSGWTEVAAGTLTDVYDQYGNYSYTYDAYGINTTITLPFNIIFYGQTVNTWNVLGSMTVENLSRSNNTWQQRPATGDVGYLTPGIFIVGYRPSIPEYAYYIDAAGTGTNTPYPSLNYTKRVYTKRENIGAANERLLVLVLGFNTYYTTVGFYNNWGTENTATQYIFYPNSNRITICPLKGVVANSKVIVANDGVTNGTNGFSVNTQLRYQIGLQYDLTTAAFRNLVRLQTTNTPTPVFFGGMPLVLRETSDLVNVDGSAIVKGVFSQGAAGSSTPSNVLVAIRAQPDPTVANYKTDNTTIYTGGFFSNARIPIVALSGIGGTNEIQVQTQFPQQFFLQQPIYLLDPSAAVSAPHTGPFNITSIRSDTVFRYTSVNAISSTSINTNLFTTSAALYVRPTGVALHRATDGGVQINNGTSTQNTQIIRQTRKYFRYQSGKSILFSTGLLFKPSYDIQRISASTANYNVTSYPFFDLTVVTEQDHGFSGKNLYVEGTFVRLNNLTTTLEPNTYNQTYYVNTVTDSKTFTLQLPVSGSLFNGPADLSPGGIGKVEVVGWYDSVVRSGLFDEQNGIYFECDGNKLFVVKRSSTNNLTGTVSAVNSSTVITGTNTKFTSQLLEGDDIVIQGMTYLITKITNDTSLNISPAYRGTNISLVRITKTEEIRVAQDQFNLDKLDGSGPSGYTINLNKMQMIYFDYSWYGAGRIRWGVRGEDGGIVYCHELVNNNTNTEAYMRSGNLPARFEIINRSQPTVALQSNQFSVSITNTQSTSGMYELKQSSNDVVYYSLSPVVSANILSNATATLTASNNPITTYRNYRVFRDNNEVPALFSALSGASVFRLASNVTMPASGNLIIGNENLNYVKLTDTVSAPVSSILINATRNTGGLLSVPQFLLNKTTVYSANQNCSPALSHWGTSVIMDGGFDEDKSYLFTAINQNNITVTNTTDVPLISVRLAPSADTGNPSSIGIRSLINRSFLTLKQIGIITGQTLNMTVRLNSNSTQFTTLSTWINTGTGSLAQYIDHSIRGTTPLPTGGDIILGFFANEQSSGRLQVTTTDIEAIRELGNSILGGNLIFPDGPDILTVFARSNTAASTTARCRVSWTEAQG